MLSSAASNVSFPQKVRQSRNLVYAFTDDEFDLLLSDDRYTTAEHVDPRHRSLQTCQMQEKQLIDIHAGLNVLTFERRKDETSLFNHCMTWTLCVLRTTWQDAVLLAFDKTTR